MNIAHSELNDEKSRLTVVLSFQTIYTDHIRSKSFFLIPGFSFNIGHLSLILYCSLLRQLGINPWVNVGIIPTQVTGLHGLNGHTPPSPPNNTKIPKQGNSWVWI